MRYPSPRLRLVLLSAAIAVACGCDDTVRTPTTPTLQNELRFSVTGTIRDDSGQPIGGANVFLLQTKSSFGNVDADATGKYQMTLRNGNYQAFVSSRGFRTLER